MTDCPHGLPAKRCPTCRPAAGQPYPHLATGDPLVQTVDGCIVVTWPHGRTATLVHPDVIEGWAQQINHLRTRLDQAVADCARNVQALIEEQDARGRAVAALAEEEAEVERLRGAREATVAAIEDGIAALDIEGLLAYDVGRIARVVGGVFRLDEVDRLSAELAEERAEIERLRGLVAAADEFGDRHVIDMREDGYVIAHPLACRATGLFACLFNVAAMELPGPPEIGKFAVTLDDAGDLVLGERITGLLCAAPHTSPDCSAGKCGGCNGDAWCDTHDDHASCACSCHRDAPETGPTLDADGLLPGLIVEVDRA